LGGFAEYFQIDPVWIRLGFLLFAFTIDFGSALLVYLIAMFVMPNADFTYSTDKDVSNHRRHDFGELFSNRQFITLLGLGLILTGIVFLIEQLYHVQVWHAFRFYYYKIKEYVWPVLLILLGIFILYRGVNRKK